MLSWAHCTHEKQPCDKKTHQGHSNLSDTSECLPCAGPQAWCRAPGTQAEHSWRCPGPSEIGPQLPHGGKNSPLSQVHVNPQSSTSAFSIEPGLLVCRPDSLHLGSKRCSPSHPSFSSHTACLGGLYSWVPMRTMKSLFLICHNHL